MGEAGGNGDYKKIAGTVIFAVLLVLSYLLLKPLLISIILGIILAFIFLPLYNLMYKITKLKNLSAYLVCIIFLLVIIIPFWYLAPIIVEQSTKIFLQFQNVNLSEIMQTIFSSFSNSETLLKEIIPATGSFATSITNYFLNSISNFLINLPTLFLHFVIILFTFFFVLRDNENLISYIKSLMPFKKEIKEKLFKSSKDITNSVVYGRIAMGIAQGLIVGVGFFVLGIPNAFFLTLLAALAGILPILGTVIVWLPVSIFLFASGENLIAFALIGFGILATIFESIVQPVLLARMVKMNSSIMLVGMIGGLFMFGILGVIIGPLILAYLIIIIEVYRNKKIPGILIEENK
jgi:predicted PurR-regulated permease PerM